MKEFLDFMPLQIIIPYFTAIIIWIYMMIKYPDYAPNRRDTWDLF